MFPILELTGIMMLEYRFAVVPLFLSRSLSSRNRLSDSSSWQNTLTTLYPWIISSM